MKKTFVLLLLIVLLSSSVAYATEIDLSKYTDDEIVTLLELVQNEVINRHIEKTATLPIGTYIVGKDLPAGSYVYAVIVKDIKMFSDGYLYGTVSVRTTEDPKDESPSKLYDFVENTQEKELFISLEEGDTFQSSVPFTLTISGGTMFK